MNCTSGRENHRRVLRTRSGAGSGRPSISLVIPAYNEAATIERTMRRSLAVLRDCTADYEFIGLDDGSQDGTFEIMKRIAAEDSKHARVLRHRSNRGIARTFEELYSLATKDFVFLISGDGQFPPEALRQCMPLLTRCDIVVCRRQLKHYTRYRLAISGLYRWLPWMLFGIDLVDPGSIKCVRREIFTAIPVRSQSVFVEAERLLRAVRRGYRFTFVDIDSSPRTGGKATGGRMLLALHAFLDLVRCWWRIVVMGER